MLPYDQFSDICPFNGVHQAPENQGIFWFSGRLTKKKKRKLLKEPCLRGVISENTQTFVRTMPKNLHLKIPLIIMVLFKSLRVLGNNTLTAHGWVKF